MKEIDLIDRQAAIDILHSYFDGMLLTDTVCPKDIYNLIEVLPSAQPEKSTTDEKMAEQRLIDANALYANMAKQKAFGMLTAKGALRAVANAPTVEERAIKDCRNCKYGRYNDHYGIPFCYNSDDCVAWNLWEPKEERKKGKWEITNAYPHNVHCSVCHKKFAQTHWTVWEDGSLPRNFCPNCGADLRGEQECWE